MESMNVFTTRELAAAIWVAVLVVWGLTRSEIRTASWSVVRSAFATKLAIIWMLGAAWMTLGVFLLAHFHLWELENLKDTIIWCVSAGLVVLVHGFSQGETRPNYPKIVRDLFNVTILLELLLSTYCFSLPVELILFIVIAFVTAFQVYSGMKDEYRDVHKIATAALIGLGLIMIWGAVAGLMREPTEILSGATLKAIARPILLTLWVLPVSYALGIIGAYEVLFIPFKLGDRRTLRFHIFARTRLIRHFGLRLSRVLDAPRKLRGGLYGLYTLQEVDDLLASDLNTEIIG